MKKSIFFALLSSSFITAHAQIWQPSTATTPTADLYRSGNLGLGTITAPTAKLHIGSNLSAPPPSGVSTQTPHLILENNATNSPLSGTTNYKWSMSAGSALNFQLSQSAGAYASIFSLSNTQAQLYKKLTMVNADINIPNGLLMVGTTAATGFTANNVGQVTSGNILVRNGSTLSVGNSFNVNTTGKIFASGIEASSTDPGFIISAGATGSPYIHMIKPTVADASYGDIGIISRYNGNTTNGSGDIRFMAWDGAATNANYQPLMLIQSNGKVSIATNSTPDKFNEVNSPYKLYVGGGILAEEATVKLSGNWPDYVFEDDYKLPSLSEIECYIKENKHLPDMPSAEEIKNDGINVGNIIKQQQEKIEQMMLLMIEMKKEIEKLKSTQSN